MTTTRIGIAALTLTLLSLNVQAKYPRSESAKRQFKIEQPCPATGHSKGPCKGYVIDHVIPLCAGGVDAPSNMQWQTAHDAKAKDKLELAQCRRLRQAG